MAKELVVQALTERMDYSSMLHSPLFRWSERRAFLDRRRGGKRLGKQSEGDRRDDGLKMGWTKPLPTPVWVLIVGWISGEDPIDPEVMSAREFLRHRAAGRCLW